MVRLHSAFLSKVLYNEYYCTFAHTFARAEATMRSTNHEKLAVQFSCSRTLQTQKLISKRSLYRLSHCCHINTYTAPYVYVSHCSYWYLTCFSVSLALSTFLEGDGIWTTKNFTHTQLSALACVHSRCSCSYSLLYWTVYSYTILQCVFCCCFFFSNVSNNSKPSAS